MPIAEINKFAGGINNHFQAHLVPDEGATDMLDCNVANGGIEPERNEIGADVAGDGFATNQTQAGDRSIVKWGEDYYWSDNSTSELSSTLGYMGIESPNSLPSIRALTRGNRFIGKYQYLLTFESDDGFESAPFEPGSELQTATVETETVVRTLVPDLDVEPFSRKHYKFRKRRGYEAGEKALFQGRVWECIQSFSGERTQAGGTSNSNRPRYLAISDWQVPGFDNEVYWKDITDVEITVEGYDSIILSNFPTPTNGNVKYINLYRTVANGGEFFLVDNLPVGQDTYRDALPDSELIAGNLLDLNNQRQPPIYRSINGDLTLVGGKYLTEVNGVFYLAVGSRVYLSGQNNPHGWEPLNYREFEDTVTGIAKLQNGVLVFTANRTYRLSGATLQDSVQIQIPVQQGCPNWKTISYFRNRPVWQSYDGVCAYSPYSDREGEYVEIVTENRYDFTGQANWSFVYEDVYYLVFTDTNTSVCIDFKTKSIFRRTVSGKWSWYDSDADQVYLSDGSSFSALGTGAERSWEYQTPDIAIDSLNTRKVLRRLWLDNSENVTVQILVDGTQRGEVLVRPDRKPVFVPNGTVGKRISFRMKGSGTVKSLRFEYKIVR